MKVGVYVPPFNKHSELFYHSIYANVKYYFVNVGFSAGPPGPVFRFQEILWILARGSGIIAGLAAFIRKLSAPSLRALAAPIPREAMTGGFRSCDGVRPPLAPLPKGRDALSKRAGGTFVAKAGSNL